MIWYTNCLGVMSINGVTCFDDGFCDFARVKGYVILLIGIDVCLDGWDMIGNYC